MRLLVVFEFLVAEDAGGQLYTGGGGRGRAAPGGLLDGHRSPPGIESSASAASCRWCSGQYRSPRETGRPQVHSVNGSLVMSHQRAWHAPLLGGLRATYPSPWQREQVTRTGGTSGVGAVTGGPPSGPAWPGRGSSVVALPRRRCRRSSRSRRNGPPRGRHCRPARGRTDGWPAPTGRRSPVGFGEVVGEGDGGVVDDRGAVGPAVRGAFAVRVGEVLEHPAAVAAVGDLQRRVMEQAERHSDRLLGCVDVADVICLVAAADQFGLPVAVRLAGFGAVPAVTVDALVAGPVVDHPALVGHAVAPWSAVVPWWLASRAASSSQPARPRHDDGLPSGLPGQSGLKQRMRPRSALWCSDHR